MTDFQLYRNRNRGTDFFHDEKKTELLYHLLKVLTKEVPHSFCPTCGTPGGRECLPLCPRFLARQIKA